jgi:hypothetical protein
VIVSPGGESWSVENPEIMSDTIFSLNEAQFQKILAAHQDWWPVASVFVSAFLAMMTGIAVERLRAWFERRKTTRERREHEVQQINAVISGLAFNLELLLHNTSQNILPHYQNTRHIAGEIDKDDSDRHVLEIIKSLGKYRYIFMTFPETYLVEYDFSKELPFDRARSGSGETFRLAGKRSARNQRCNITTESVCRNRDGSRSTG